MIKMPVMLASESIYHFDIDKKKLNISDYDVMWIPSDGQSRLSMMTIRKGTRLPYKIIRRPNSGKVLGNFYMTNFKNPSFDAVFKKIDDGDLISGQASRGLSLSGDVLEQGQGYGLDLLAKEDVMIELGVTIIGQIIYSQSLSGDGDGGEMMFAGSIQPSDYDNIGRFFNVVGARKRVLLSVTSKNKLECRLFDPGNPNFFPQAVLADHVHPKAPEGEATKIGKVYKFEKKLVFDDLIGSSRARYFALTAKAI